MDIAATGAREIKELADIGQSIRIGGRNTQVRGVGGPFSLWFGLALEVKKGTLEGSESGGG